MRMLSTLCGRSTFLSLFSLFMHRTDVASISSSFSIISASYSSFFFTSPYGFHDSYSEQVTEAEFASVPARVQEHIKRTAANNLAMASGVNQWQFYTPAAAPTQYRRVGAFCSSLLLLGC